MNYTENLKLPQWNESDRIRMKDFNDAMKKIDQGYTTSAAVQPYVIGSYVGDGSDIVDVQLGFEPSFVIISGMKSCSEENINDALRYFAISGGNGDLVHRVQFASFGFVVYTGTIAGTTYPKLAEEGRTYYYIAFR